MRTLEKILYALAVIIFLWCLYMAFTAPEAIQAEPPKVNTEGLCKPNTKQEHANAEKSVTTHFNALQETRAEYNNIADNIWSLIMFIKTQLPDDVIVYIILHEDLDDFGNLKLRTIGKLLDKSVCIEGMVTICLHCVIQDGKHIFVTQNRGNDISKSPEGMFETEIENDLKAVDTTIREFWGL